MIIWLIFDAKDFSSSCYVEVNYKIIPLCVLIFLYGGVHYDLYKSMKKLKVSSVLYEDKCKFYTLQCRVFKSLCLSSVLLIFVFVWYIVVEVENYEANGIGFGLAMTVMNIFTITLIEEEDIERKIPFFPKCILRSLCFRTLFIPANEPQGVFLSQRLQLLDSIFHL